MAKLTVLPITPDGVDFAADNVAANVAGDSVDQSSGLLIAVENGAGAPITVTVSAPVAEAKAGDFGQQAVADIEVVVTNGTTEVFTIPKGFAVLGDYVWTYSSITSVKIGVYSLAPDS